VHVGVHESKAVFHGLLLGVAGWLEGSSRQMMGRPGNPVKRGGQFLTLTSMLGPT
jgi:hypothetical protein